MKKLFLSLLLFSLLVAGCLHEPKTGGVTGAVVADQPAATDSGGDSQPFQPLSGVVVSGSRVSLLYLGTFENGTVFDTNIVEEALKTGLNPPESLPLLNVTAGSGEVIAGFDKALIGMRVGQEKTVTIPPEEAYGQPREDFVIEVNASDLDQNGGEPAVGGYVATSTGARGAITAVENGVVTVDFNHPLAGKTLVFKIIVKSIE